MDSSSVDLNLPLQGDVSVAWIYQQGQTTNRAKSTSDQELHDNIVYVYFENKKIRMLFDFMVQHLMIYEPDNPIEYLKDLADKLLMWRSGTVSKAPQLFEDRHVEAIYTALDPAELGVISLRQYHNGFKTLMLKNYPLYPDLNDDGLVERRIFIKNALGALDKHLMDIVKPSYTTLCELTILPDESYDILFQDYPTEPSQASKDKDIEKEEDSIKSCPSSSSCVHLLPVDDDRVSIMSEVSYISEDEISVSDVDSYDFLIKTSLVDGGTELGKRKVSIPGSKITILAGKTGDVKHLLADDLDISNMSSGTKSSN